MGRMAEVQRKLLEQLMGAEAMGIIQQDISLWDPKVCRPFVAGVCQHDLFTNTKMDLGTCPRTHSVKLKNEYESLMKKAVEDKDEAKIAELNRLKVDYEQAIFAFIDECDRRIRAAHRRLDKTPEENKRTTDLMREIGEIEGAYQAAMAEVEKLGSEGKVEESMAELTKAEALKGEKEEKERDLQQLTETSGASGHQKLRVCDICGAYLSVLDSDRRLADHFGGRMHLGYLQLRQYMDEWRARGPLPIGPAPSFPPGGMAPGHGAHSNGYGPPPTAPTGPAQHNHTQAPPPQPQSFRPIPQQHQQQQQQHNAAPLGPPPPSFVPSSGGSASGRGGSDRDRGGAGDREDRDRGSSRRDDRDRDSSRRHDDRDRDRDYRSSRSSRDDRDRSDRDRGDRDRERDRDRSKRDDRSRSPRTERHSSRRSEDKDKEHRSSSRREDDHDDRDRRSSRRYDEDREQRDSGAGSSSGRTRKSYDDLDAPADKRRKTEA